MQVQVEALGMSRALALLGGHRHRGSSSRRVKNKMVVEEYNMLLGQ